MDRKETALSPIAIVGLGCRFPGTASDPQAFWDMLCEGRDGIVEVPPERWDWKRFYDPDPDKPGKTYVRQGGFLRQPIDGMDALFFGITPREAEELDPQQRLLLEVAWEALEDAGIPADGLAGSATGVFMGGFINDHFLTRGNVNGRRLAATHTAVSFTHTILSARIAYALDLRGPCLTLDTACSSSLAALHLACQSLWAGESELALAGGVNVMTRPETPVIMCKARLLAADGRSKSFDARGDGYGRGEGAGVVVLKPLAAAERDGDLIYALVRATGVNQDGRTEGITVPNPGAQADLIRRVGAQAGIDPSRIRYFEAHGTGTAVGDPLECQALGEALGQGREEPCWVGSVKANIGHLEAAAGVAGVIKTALILHHGLIPPVANLETPNPRIPFHDLGLRLPRRVEPLPEGEGPALAGVNSFGYGGTNAHAILQSPPRRARERRQPAPARPHLLLLSARSEPALRALSGRYGDFLAGLPEEALPDVCHSAALRRAQHPWRLAIHAENGAALLRHLTEHAQGGGAFLIQGRAAARQQPVFVFTGMGPQWWGMGRELLEREPVFRREAEAADAVFRRLAGWSILEEMRRPEAESQMGRTAIAQSANFVLQAALAALLRSWGVEPAAIVGHSVGEVSAAYVSGALDLEQAVTVSYHRGRLQQSMAGRGRMLAAAVSEERARELVARHGEEQVSIGAVNSPAALTLAGEAAALEAIAAELEAEEVFHRFLRVELAYHSPVLDPLREEVMQVLADLQPRPPRIPLYSTVTGARVEAALHDAAYWFANIRQPVRFADAISALLESGARLFLEMGPHPVLGTSLRETLAARNVEGQTVASLKRGEPEQSALLACLGELHIRGGVIDWRAFHGDGGRYLRLPAYPWQRETYWKESPAGRRDRLGHDGHPLLGAPADAPGRVWEQPVNRQYLPWLEHHRIEADVVLPGAAYVELGLALAREALGDGPCLLEHLHFDQALVLGAADEPLLRSALEDSGVYALHSRAADGGEWTRHGGGRVARVGLAAPAPLDLAALKARCPLRADMARVYAGLTARGLNYGPGFQTQSALRLGAPGSDELLLELTLDPALTADAAAYRLHPTLLDGAFQALISLLGEDDPRSFLPVSIARLHWLAAPAPGEILWCHARLSQRGADHIEADLDLCAGDGRVLAALRGLRCQALGGARGREDWQDWLHWPRWESAPPQTGGRGGGRWLILADAAAPDLAAALGRRGVTDLTLATALSAAAAAAPWDAVVYARALETAADDPCGEAALADLLGVFQAFAGREPAPRVYLVTRHGQAAGDALAPGRPDPAQAARIGLGRVAAAEHPELRVTLVDMDDDWDALAEELLGDAAPAEAETALRRGQRLLYRLDRATPRAIEADYRASRALAPAAAALQLDFSDASPCLTLQTGGGALVIERLALAAVGGYRAAAGRDPQGREYLLVLTPEQAAGGALAAPEDAFFALPLATPDAGLIAHLLPQTLARLALGEEALAGRRVLVLGGDDAATLAIARLARRRGADVHALWRHPPGRESLTSLGVAAWPADTLDFTACGTVDLVVNGLDAEFARHGLERLAADGRFVELNPANPGLLPPGDGLQSHVRVSLAALARTWPRSLRQRLRETAAELAADSAPGARLFPAAQLDAAWAAARQGEAAVLDLRERGGLAVRPARLQGAPIRGDASYLVSGGFGGFGLVLARWLADQGARHLLLLGRRGAADPAARVVVEELEAAGVKVRAAALDVADGDQVAALIEQVRRSGPPLRGIFHTAGVLDDARLVDLDPERLARVMAAKARGAWHLHRLTRDLELDAFVLFSSISSLIGNPGQGNYVAANAFLDALAAQRRAAGLAGLSLNWGVLGEVGMAARQQEVERYLAAMGIAAIPPRGAMDALDFALRQGVPQLGVMAVDWPRWVQANADAAATPRFSRLADRAAAGQGADAFQARLRGLAPEARQEAALGVLREVVAAVMRLPDAALDNAIPLTGLGLDSLMASELQVAIQGVTGVRLSVLELMKGNAIIDLARRLTADPDAPPATAAPAVAETAAPVRDESVEMGEL